MTLCATYEPNVAIEKHFLLFNPILIFPKLPTTLRCLKRVCSMLADQMKFRQITDKLLTIHRRDDL